MAWRRGGATRPLRITGGDPRDVSRGGAEDRSRWCPEAAADSTAPPESERMHDMESVPSHRFLRHSSRGSPNSNDPRWLALSIGGRRLTRRLGARRRRPGSPDRQGSPIARAPPMAGLPDRQHSPIARAPQSVGSSDGWGSRWLSLAARAVGWGVPLGRGTFWTSVQKVPGKPCADSVSSHLFGHLSKKSDETRPFSPVPERPRPAADGMRAGQATPWRSGTPPRQRHPPGRSPRAARPPADGR